MDLVSGVNVENAAPLVVGHLAAKRGEKHHKSQDDCQNCGAKLVGEYCHECGQHGHVHRSVLHVVEEVFHGITHFDSRTWRSLPMLAFRPGTLTRNYVMGQRARYVPPFAMFLFSIFAMFLVFAFLGGPGLVASVPSAKAEAVASARKVVRDREEGLREAQGDVRDAQNELASLQADTDTSQGELGAAVGVVGAAQGQAQSAQAQLDQAKAALARVIATPEPVIVPPSKLGVSPNESGGEAAAVAKSSPTFASQADKDEALAELAVEKAKKSKDGNPLVTTAIGVAEQAVRTTPVVALPPTRLEKGKVAGNSKLKVDLDVGGSKVDVKVGEADDVIAMLKDSMRRGDFINTPWPEINEKIKHKIENPDLFIYKLQNTAYKFSFLLVPLSLPFIWIMLFWKRNVTLFDHAVFSLYSLSFVSFLFIFISLGARFFPVGQLFFAAGCLMPIHIFFQFKGAYQLKWFSALWRTILFCSVFSWTVILAFFVAIIALGVTG